jgi:NAD(P)H-dependent flavin oxidoreductase YrpB (nitropropane dioxygenase family)
MEGTRHPQIIQGGMGVGVSNWRLANAVSRYGQLGVVSGTFIDTVLARRLQDGDPSGLMRLALSHFPNAAVATRVLRTYFIEGGKAKDAPYKPVPMHGLRSPQELIDLTVVANFVEVFLAKHGHSGVVGINYLTKIELPTLPSLYGAMLAGVDYVLMGAGIPKAIPGILDKLQQHLPVSLRITVDGAGAEEIPELQFDPSRYEVSTIQLRRPNFLAIVSSPTLAQTLLRKSSGKVDGFVVEHHSAGGHNAPPRGELRCDETGQPVYGAKDEPNLHDFAKLGAPFWLAGSRGSHEKLLEAQSFGAVGIQVGTAFAFCDESGITDEIKSNVRQRVWLDKAEVFTDPRASSSGYPFKVVSLPETMSEESEYMRRPRVCDLGYLRSAYRAPNGSVGFRCPAEPEDDYVKKGGERAETANRKCLCNGLLATVGYPQVRESGYVEAPLVTAGNELNAIREFIKSPQAGYSAADVLDSLLGRTPRTLVAAHDTVVRQA